MFSRASLRIAQIIRARKEEDMVDENVNDAEKETQSNRNNRINKNAHQSPNQRDRYVNSPERQRCLLTSLRYDQREDGSPLYSSTQTSRPSSGLPDQQKPAIEKKEIKNHKPPPYDLPENMSSASRCQYIRGLIERRKAEVQTLERQLEEEIRKAAPLSTDTTSRVGDPLSMHRNLQSKAVQGDTGKEGTLSTGLPAQIKGTMQDIEYYIQLCNKTRDIMIRDTKLMQEFKNKTDLEKEKERGKSILQ